MNKFVFALVCVALLGFAAAANAECDLAATSTQASADCGFDVSDAAAYPADPSTCQEIGRTCSRSFGEFTNCYIDTNELEEGCGEGSADDCSSPPSDNPELDEAVFAFASGCANSCFTDRVEASCGFNPYESVQGNCTAGSQCARDFDEFTACYIQQNELSCDGDSCSADDNQADIYEFAQQCAPACFGGDVQESCGFDPNYDAVPDTCTETPECRADVAAFSECYFQEVVVQEEEASEKSNELFEYAYKCNARNCDGAQVNARCGFDPNVDSFPVNFYDSCNPDSSCFAAFGDFTRCVARAYDVFDTESCDSSDEATAEFVSNVFQFAEACTETCDPTEVVNACGFNPRSAQAFPANAYESCPADGRCARAFADYSECYYNENVLSDEQGCADADFNTRARSQAVFEFAAACQTGCDGSKVKDVCGFDPISEEFPKHFVQACPADSACASAFGEFALCYHAENIVTQEESCETDERAENIYAFAAACNAVCESSFVEAACGFNPNLGAAAFPEDYFNTCQQGSCKSAFTLFTQCYHQEVITTGRSSCGQTGQFQSDLSDAVFQFARACSEKCPSQQVFAECKLDPFSVTGYPEAPHDYCFEADGCSEAQFEFARCYATEYDIEGADKCTEEEDDTSSAGAVSTAIYDFTEACVDRCDPEAVEAACGFSPFADAYPAPDVCGEGTDCQEAFLTFAGCYADRYNIDTTESCEASPLSVRVYEFAEECVSPCNGAGVEEVCGFNPDNGIPSDVPCSAECSERFLDYAICYKEANKLTSADGCCDDPRGQEIYDFANSCLPQETDCDVSQVDKFCGFNPLERGWPRQARFCDRACNGAVANLFECYYEEKDIANNPDICCENPFASGLHSFTEDCLDINEGGSPYAEGVREECEALETDVFQACRFDARFDLPEQCTSPCAEVYGDFYSTCLLNADPQRVPLGRARELSQSCEAVAQDPFADFYPADICNKFEQTVLGVCGFTDAQFGSAATFPTECDASCAPEFISYFNRCLGDVPTTGFALGAAALDLDLACRDTLAGGKGPIAPPASPPADGAPEDGEAPQVPVTDPVQPVAGDTVRVRVVLDRSIAGVQMDEILFRATFAADTAFALGIPARRISVVRLTAGSVIVDFDILPGQPDEFRNDVSPQAAYEDLKAQLADPDSVLRQTPVYGSYDANAGVQQECADGSLQEECPDGSSEDYALIIVAIVVPLVVIGLAIIAYVSCRGSKGDDSRFIMDDNYTASDEPDHTQQANESDWETVAPQAQESDKQAASAQVTVDLGNNI